MARKRLHPEGTKPVSFRLPLPDYRTYQKKVEESGLTPSDFFREYVLNNKTQVVARKKKSADHSRLLFLANKMSNNINQLAYRANSDHLAGVLHEGTYSQILANLGYISRCMKVLVENVD